ncbi:hypothetical protein BCV72DRAFT_241180 [Rhizopus microsporus var. microsporus]|uniref:Uncharacterized protein n=2 Tax=Rhizopus microsporus TaxID=58291 RepID=A0A2G4SG85_RHIZD|nr:uncharacterized protein RHIMIDRAFT_273799 [Rhizopus microsporus ATCC 52813]ORE07553.1 hypothetical protein BCV72DRAFT_241180 [Rhizopus microsporus var. microsporus]PHZ07781.1 hypothetical protein RHIMIDRAFT_273799 [Rhizopus microsporus ATCC 52813]
MNYCNRTGRSGIGSSSNNSSSLIIDSDCSDDLIINEEDEELRARNSEDEDYYKPIAPPPSPQQEPITLQDDIHEKRDTKLHAQTLDQLLRKTLDRQQSRICKRQKRRSSIFNNNQHKLKELLSSIVDEDMIHELRDMVL